MVEDNSVRTFYLGEVFDRILILIGQTVFDDATHDALILSHPHSNLCSD